MRKKVNDDKVFFAIHDMCIKSKESPCPIPARVIADTAGYPEQTVYNCIHRLKRANRIKIHGNTKPYRYSIPKEMKLGWLRRLFIWTESKLSQWI